MWHTIGHPKIVDLLQRALAQENLSHAYLLVGPPRTGKLTLARDLAMTLNCSAESGARPCGQCPACQKIASGKHADVQVIGLNQNLDPEETKEKTEIGIGQINNMLHSSNLPPFEGKYRVYIIEEAGVLSLDAANRLLKTLEEPPARVVFVLLTTNLRLIPATIVSRCQRLNLSRVKTAEIEQLLTEGRHLESGKAQLLARLSRGSPGWALEAAEAPALLQGRQEKFEKMLAIVKGDYYARFAAAAQLALQFAKKRDTVYETLDNWLSWWRDLLLVKADCSGDIINFDYFTALAEMAGAFNLIQIKTALQSIREALEQLKLNANARLVLEVLMLNLPRPAVAVKAAV